MIFTAWEKSFQSCAFENNHTVHTMRFSERCLHPGFGLVHVTGPRAGIQGFKVLYLICWWAIVGPPGEIFMASWLACNCHCFLSHSFSTPIDPNVRDWGEFVKTKKNRLPEISSTYCYFSDYLEFYSVVEEVACRYWLSSACQKNVDDGGMPVSDNTITFV